MRRITLVLILLLAGGCGVPLDSEPIILDPLPELPGDIGIIDDRALEAVTLYLVRNDRITAITRDLVAPPTAESVVESLLAGTTGPEERANLRTSIPPGSEVSEIEVRGGVATIDLTRQFTQVGGDEEVLAVAQIVFSLAGLPEIDSVQFLISGIPTAVPIASGVLTDRPVDSEDYRSLLDG